MDRAPAQTHAASTARPPGAEPFPPGLVRLVVVLTVGMVPVILDSTIVNVALATMARDLGAAMTTVQWVSTAYLLATAVMIPLAGWAEQRLGSRNLWLAALGVFAAGSLGAALAWSVPALVLWRAVQGAGGGIVVTLMSTISVKAAHGRNLGRLMTTIGLPIIVVPVLGPMIGGAILTHASWRWLFWINLPLAAAGLALAWRGIPRDTGQTGVKIDLVGLLLAGTGAALTLGGMVQAGGRGTFAAVEAWVPAATGIVLLVGFVVWTTRRSRNPLVDLTLFRQAGFAVAGVTLTLAGVALFSGTLLIPLFYQQVRGQSALAAGVALIWQGVGSLLSRSLVGRVTDRFGARWVVIAGAVLTAAATIPFAPAGPGTPDWQLASWLVLRGAGLGGIVMPAMTASYVGLAEQHVASASIIARTLQQVGGAFGAALAAVVLEWTASGSGLAAGFHTAFWTTAALTTAVAVTAVFLPGSRR